MFFDDLAISFQIIDSSRGNNDFRKTIIVKNRSDKRYVIKLADNGFTFPEKLKMWQRTAEEYRKLGYYCPKIFCDKKAVIPILNMADIALLHTRRNIRVTAPPVSLLITAMSLYKNRYQARTTDTTSGK